MLQYINYRTHLLLNNKYKLFINITIYALIFLFIINTQKAYCMTEGYDVPVIAEAKEFQNPSQQSLAIKREIIEYADLQAPLLKQIENQNNEITVLQDKIVELEARNKYLNSELRAYVDEEIMDRRWEQRFIEDERSSDEYEDTFRRVDDLYQS